MTGLPVLTVFIRAEGSPSFIPALRGPGGSAVYTPVEGVRIREQPSSGVIERKGWPPSPETMEFLVEITGKGAAGIFATHLMKAAAGRVRLWINRRPVSSAEEALAVLREAQGPEQLRKED